MPRLLGSIYRYSRAINLVHHFSSPSTKIIMPKRGKRAASLLVRKKTSMNGQAKRVTRENENNHTSEIPVDCYELVGDTIPTLDSVRDFRITVAYLFLNVHGGKEDFEENPWCGKNGTIAKIREAMNLCRGTRIDHILRHVLECKMLGLRYAGENEKFNCGRTVSIQHDTSEAQIVIDAIENGLSLTIAWNLVN